MENFNVIRAYRINEETGQYNESDIETVTDEQFDKGNHCGSHCNYSGGWEYCKEWSPSCKCWQAA